MPRNIHDVIDRIFAYIPQDETALRDDLARLSVAAAKPRRPAPWSLPELQTKHWGELQDILWTFDCECDPRPDWLEQVRLIVTGEA